MNKEDLKKIEEKLLSEKVRIEKDLEKLKGGLDFGSDVDNFDEETDEAEEMGNYLGIKKTQDARLSQIEKALQKIKEGIYGVCEKCGEPIEAEILEIDPESLLCKNCKRGA
ncbi:MAG: TraR/DksA C4-type zinc finger protein [Patescibacteria group bacterium]